MFIFARRVWNVGLSPCRSFLYRVPTSKATDPDTHDWVGKLVEFDSNGIDDDTVLFRAKSDRGVAPSSSTSKWACNCTHHPYSDKRLNRKATAT